jgi:hypothetical protein
MAGKFTFLYGIRWRTWRRLLRETRYDVDMNAWPRASAIGASAMVNERLARRDDRLDLDGVRVEPPIFILGHWRSGTTHLHYLLDQDPALATPSTYQCAFPHSFASAGPGHRRLLERFAPEGRPQDNMPVGFDAPQEDEMALALMCLKSPYLGWAFPRQERRYRRYLSFGEATEDDRRTFMQALRLLLRKLSYVYRLPLVLKSPGHTARLPMLAEAYPEARYILITRDPYEVFQSSLYFHEAWRRSFAFLQKPDVSGMDERVLTLYQEMYEAFFENEHLLPADRFHRIRFEDLRADPVGELRRLYAAIGLGEFPGQAISRYLDRIRDYEQNPYPPLTAEQRAVVAERWSRSFDAWGYRK